MKTKTRSKFLRTMPGETRSKKAISTSSRQTTKGGNSVRLTRQWLVGWRKTLER